MVLEWIPHTQKLNMINASEAEGVYQTYQAFDSLKRSFDMLSISFNERGVRRQEEGRRGREGRGKGQRERH